MMIKMRDNDAKNRSRLFVKIFSISYSKDSITEAPMRTKQKRLFEPRQGETTIWLLPKKSIFFTGVSVLESLEVYLLKYIPTYIVSYPICTKNLRRYLVHVLTK